MTFFFSLVIPRKDTQAEIKKAIDAARANSFECLVQVLRAGTKQLGPLMNKE